VAPSSLGAWWLLGLESGGSSRRDWAADEVGLGWRLQPPLLGWGLGVGFGTDGGSGDI
jgi:hypothetical protein